MPPLKGRRSLAREGQRRGGALGRCVHRVPGLLLALGLGSACDLAYPEVVVVNRTSEAVQLRDPTLSGCAWSAVLVYGQSTTVGRCLPGRDHLHFEKLDLSAPGIPRWFRYQTSATHQLDYGDYRLLEVTLDDLEQDFAAPESNGH
ncbi:MAG: hypothetical protein IPL40_02530 [Proteobacteria bacterium]|nr:hypothetical protein [Pseudomonadota bacterium]